MAEESSWEQAIDEGRRWREDEALGAIEAWERSGLSMSAFGRRHGMAAGRLRWWRKRLEARKVGATDGGRIVQDAALAPLVPVMVTAAGHVAPAIAVTCGEVRIEIAAPEAVGPVWVAELVQALRRQT